MIRPLEDRSVGRGGVVVVVLTRDVEGEIEKGLTAGFQERGESIVQLVQPFVTHQHR